MELGFVVSALQRRWWIVLATTAVFGVLASLAFGGTTERYQSESVLLVVPNSTGGVVQQFGDSTRYVKGQISSMESEAFQEQVAARVGPAETAQSIDLAVTIKNESNTDIVTITVFTEAPQRSESIAQAYGELYMEGLRTDFDDEQRQILQDIESELADILSGIEQANDNIAAALRPFLPTPQGQTPPDPSVYAPDAVTARDILTLQYSETYKQQLTLQRSGEEKVNSTLIQVASRSTAPLVESNSLKLAAGLVGGFGLGCLIALMWNRFSSKVADEAMVSEIIGLPIAGTVGHSRTLARRPVSALYDPPEPLRGSIGHVAVSADAKGPGHRPTRIVVAGAQRGAGATTLAMLVAHEFVANGATVTLVDADQKSDQLASIVGTLNASFDDLASSDLDAFNSDVVLVGRTSPSMSLRRSDVGGLLDLAGRGSRVVIVDGGSVLSSATTVDLCHAADAVILAVPTNRQNIATLQAVARAVTRPDVLVVTTAPKRRTATEGGSATYRPSNDITGPFEIDSLFESAGVRQD